MYHIATGRRLQRLAPLPTCGPARRIHSRSPPPKAPSRFARREYGSHPSLIVHCDDWPAHPAPHAGAPGWRRADAQTSPAASNPIHRFAIHPQVGPNPQLHPQPVIAKRRMRLNSIAQPFDPWRVGTMDPLAGEGVRCSPVQLTSSTWQDHMTSKRSSIITLFHAVTKSRTNFSLSPSAA